jgi:hypothetical protein
VAETSISARAAQTARRRMLNSFAFIIGSVWIQKADSRGKGRLWKTSQRTRLNVDCCARLAVRHLRAGVGRHDLAA